MPAADEVPPNVIFYDVGRDGLSRLFGTRLSEHLGITEPGLQHRMIQLFQIAFREFAYIVTEYKPTHGTASLAQEARMPTTPSLMDAPMRRVRTRATPCQVFAEYLKPYSHWSYTDIDMLIGDLPLHIERSELADYDSAPPPTEQQRWLCETCT